MSIGGLLLFGLLAALANIVGGLLLTASAAFLPNLRFLKYLVALGAGFMLAAIFVEIVPEVVRLWTAGQTAEEAAGSVLGAMTLLLAGYLLIHLSEHTIAPHFHFGAELHCDTMVRSGVAQTAIIGLSIHTFFDGASIAAAFLVNFKAGLLISVAILLHKVPEGFTAASIMLASGRSARQALFAATVIGAATLAGVLSVVALQSRSDQAVMYALPFSAGVTLYVAASDLIPEVNHAEEKNPLVSVVVFVGVALFYVLNRLIDG